MLSFLGGNENYRKSISNDRRIFFFSFWILVSFKLFSCEQKDVTFSSEMNKAWTGCEDSTDRDHSRPIWNNWVSQPNFDKVPWIASTADLLWINLVSQLNFQKVRWIATSKANYAENTVFIFLFVCEKGIYANICTAAVLTVGQFRRNVPFPQPSSDPRRLQYYSLHEIGVSHWSLQRGSCPRRI